MWGIVGCRLAQEQEKIRPPKHDTICHSMGMHKIRYTGQGITMEAMGYLPTIMANHPASA